mmetsp:Transcript_182/g.431  ORF Transcript_182/g.431 Transcript_182/m.431 type:complete len:364 (-) Transcript_182:348-1439(-)
MFFGRNKDDSSDMSEDAEVSETGGGKNLLNDPNVIVYAAAIAVVLISVPICHRIPRNRGKNPVFHAVYWGLAVVSVLFVPDFVQDKIFNAGGVLVIGTLLPAYESIYAVCSIGEDDDTVWLQYWISAGTFTYATEFMDIIVDKFPAVAERWYEMEFYIMLWLLLPFTDGATVIYDKFTEPYLAPLCQKAKNSMEGYAGIIIGAVNAGYLWMIWMTFMTMPEEARRFVTVAVGTVYPLMASIVAVTTKSDVSDDTHWLTYWPCFSLLFIAMDYLEEFVGGIKGFYSICLCATVYLFLPMFRGADVVLRKVLVPLSGQYENMVLRDAYLLRRELEKSIKPQYHESVRVKAASVFLKGTDLEKKLE